MHALPELRDLRHAGALLRGHDRRGATGYSVELDLSAIGPTGTRGDTDAARNGGTPTAQAVHLIAEAERLAYADRDKYIADTVFVPLPGNSPHALLDPGYLTRRAVLIDPHRSMGTAQPGDFGPPRSAPARNLASTAPATYPQPTGTATPRP